MTGRAFDDAERHFHTARALAVTVGDHKLQLDAENNLGETLRLKGNLREAERMYESVARLAEERNWPISSAIAHLNLALISQSREDASFARINVDQAESHLQDHPKHWAWMYVGIFRAVWAAEVGDENTCRAWWSVSNDRGLGRMVSIDLVEPLKRLAVASVRNGWNDLAQKAITVRESILQSSPASPQTDIHES